MLHHATGEYVELPGWSEDLSECRAESDLPTAAREYLQFIAEFVGVPVALVGVGPGRDEVIWTEASAGMAGAARPTGGNHLSSMPHASRIRVDDDLFGAEHVRVYRETGGERGYTGVGTTILLLTTNGTARASSAPRR